MKTALFWGAVYCTTIYCAATYSYHGDFIPEIFQKENSVGFRLYALTMFTLSPITVPCSLGILFLAQ